MCRCDRAVAAKNPVITFLRVFSIPSLLRHLSSQLGGPSDYMPKLLTICDKKDLPSFLGGDDASCDFVDELGPWTSHLPSPQGPLHSTGLLWASIGGGRPAVGEELKHEALAAALKGKTEFSQAEWDAFGVKGLDITHYIKAGGEYFRPTYRPL